MSKLLSDYEYHLPEELIAQVPIYPRDTSRLMVLNKVTGDIDHCLFTDVIDKLSPGDVLVINDTKVIPARLLGNRVPSGGKAEVLLLHPLGEDIWEALVRPGRRLKKGAKIEFGEGRLEAEIINELPEGRRKIKLNYTENFENLLDSLGEMPLPPYIKEKLNDPNRYQTVYARERGSAAAPTAGLHFTPNLLEQIKAKGIMIAKVTLHVGIGTFRPVQVANITEHNMHSEFYHIDQNVVDILNNARHNNNRIVAVGTTSVRALESMPQVNGQFIASSGSTNIFIYPGYKFKAVDALITNFHLPKSSLLMLVSALAGRENIMHAYQIAIKEKYRFFSFGDAMMII